MKRKSSLFSPLFILATILTTAPCFGASGTWNVDAAGNWSAAGSWVGGTIADGAGFTANITFNITADRTVTNDTAGRVIGNLVFQDLTTASHNWTLTGTAANFLTLDVTSGTSGITVNNQTATISLPLAGDDGITASGAGTLVLSGANTFTGQFTIGSGHLTAVTSNAGLGASGAGNETIVQSGGTLNVTNATGNALNLGAEQVRIAGFGQGGIGAIVNQNVAGVTATGQINALQDVLLTANSAFGGTQRFDVRGGAALLDLGGFRLLKFGASQTSLVGGTLTAGNIDVTSGTFSLESTTAATGLGTVSFANGTTLGLWNNSGAFTRQMVFGAPMVLGTTQANPTINELGSNTVAALGSSITLANNTNITSTNAATNLVLNGNIGESSGSYGVVKGGVGRLTLGGAATFSGPLTISDQTATGSTVALAAGSNLTTRHVLVGNNSTFDASAVGGYTVPAGGTFMAGRSLAPANDVVGALTTSTASTFSVGAHFAARTATLSSGLTLNGTTLNIDLGNALAPGGTTSDLLVVNGGLNVNGANSIFLRPVNGMDFSPSGSSGFAVGNYTLATYTGALSITGGAGIANAANYRQTFTIDPISSPGSILLNVAGAAILNPWDNGAGTGVWKTNGDLNWNGGGKFLDLDAAFFQDLGTTQNVTVSGSVVPSAITFDGGNYVIKGPGRISGPGGLMMNSPDNVTMAGDLNDFAGAVSVNSGTLSAAVLGGAGGAGSLGTASTITLNGGVLNYTGPTATSNKSMTLINSAVPSHGRISVEKPFSALTLNATNPITSSALGGGELASDLIKSGDGALTISNVVNHAGNFVVNDGVLRAGTNSALGTKTVTVNAGGTFDPNGQTGAAGRPTVNIIGSGMPGQAAIWNGGGAQTNNPLFGRINLTGDATFGTNVRYDLNGGAGLDSLGVAGVTINGGTNTLTKTGWGETWWAPNAGVTLGNIVVQAGRLGIQSSSNLGSNLFSITVDPAGELGSFSAITNDKPIILNGGNFMNNNDATTETWTGGLSLTADSYIGQNANVATRIAQMTNPNFLLGGFTLNKLHRNVLNISGATAGTGAGNINVYAGTVNLNSGTAVNGAGTLVIKQDGLVNLDDTGGAVTLSKDVRLDGGTLQNMNGPHNLAQTITVGGHGRIFNNTAGGALTLGNLVVPNAGGVQFGTTGQVVLSTINGAAPAVGPLGPGYNAGPAPATTGFAEWNGTQVTVQAPNYTTSTTGPVNLSAATATDNVLAAHTAGGTQPHNTITTDLTVNSLIAERDVAVNSGALLRIGTGGLIMRTNNQWMQTTAGAIGRLTSGADNGALHVNLPEHFEARSDMGLRLQVVDNPLPAGAFNPVTLVKNGPGGLTQMGSSNFPAPNTIIENQFTGGVVINSGRLTAAGGFALGTGPVTVRDGGQLAAFGLLGATSTFFANNLSIAGQGTGEGGGFLGVIRLGTGGQTFNTFGGNVMLADSARLHNQNANDGVVAGRISGGPNAVLQKTGGNTIVLSNLGNTYAGVTQLGSRDQTAGGALGVYKLANGGLPSSIGTSSNAASNLVLNGNGILSYRGAGDSTDRLFTLGNSFGFNAIPTATIQALGYGSLNFTNPGNLAFTEGSYRTLQLDAPASGVGIFLNGNLRENTFAPVLTDPDHGFGQLTKNGAGLWTLTTDQKYSGVTTVNDGWLRLGNGGTSGMIGDGSLSGLGQNTVALGGNGDLQVNRSDTVTFTGAINGNGTFATSSTELVQMGTGTTRLTGPYDNGSLKVRVENGTLELAKDSNTSVHSFAIQGVVNGGTLKLGGTGGTNPFVPNNGGPGINADNFVDQIFDGGATGNATTTVFMNGGVFDLNGRSEALSRVEGAGGVIRNDAAATTSTLIFGTGNVSSFIDQGVRTPIENGAGTTAVAKTGTGSIILAGANTYSGATTINNGVLQVGNGGTTGSLGAGAVQVDALGALAINRSNAFALTNAITGTGTLVQAGTGTTTRSTALPTGLAATVNRGVLNLNLSTTNNVISPVSLVTLNGGQLRLTGGAGGTSTQTIGALNIGGGDLRVDGTAGLTTANLPTTFNRLPGGSIDLSTAGATAVNSSVANTNGVIGTARAAYATINGGNWATQSGGAITSFAGYAPDAYASGNHTDVVTGLFAGPATTSTVRFNTAGGGLNLGGSSLTLEQGGVLLTPAAAISSISNGTLMGGPGAGSEVLVHQNSLAPFTISAVIGNNVADATGLTKAGPGTLILTGANTYTGETHINQGTLRVGAGGTTGQLGGGAIYNDGTLVFDRSDTLRVDNNIGGVGMVVQQGTGTTRLLGGNTFTGGLVISKGTIAAESNVGLGLGAGTVTLGDSNTGADPVQLSLDAGADIFNPIVVSADGTGTATIASTAVGGGINPVLINGPVSLNRPTTISSANGDRTTFSNVISGNVGELTITGGARTTFEANNTFDGDINITGAGSILQVGTGAFAWQQNQLPDDASVTLGAGTFFQLNGDSEVIGQLNSTATNAMVRAIAGGPTVLTVANGGTYDGQFDGGVNTGLTIESTGGTLSFGGTTDNATGRVLVNGGTFLLNKTSSASVHSVAVDFTINSGTARITGPGGDQIWDGSATNRTNVVINGGSFDLNGNSEAFSELNGYGGVVTNGAAATTSTLSLGTNNWSNTGYYGSIENGAGTVAVTKVGTGGLILAGTNTYTGTTTISGGTLELGNGGTGGSLASPSIVNNAQLVANRSDAFSIVSDISGTGRFVQNGSGTTRLTGTNSYAGTTTINAGTLQVGDNGPTGSLGAGNVTINEGAWLAFSRSNAYAAGNAISGPGGVRQIGSGATTLTGTNRYLGLTEVLSGTLLVNGDQSAATGAVNVSPGATLGGTGLIGGVVTIMGNLAPGTSPGTLTLVNALTMTNASTYLVEIDGTAAWDKTLANGVTLNTPTLDIFLLNQPTAGFQYPIIDNTSAAPISGIFNGLAEGAAFVDDGWNWNITYGGGSGNDAVLTAVSPIPEPAHLALFAVSSIFVLRRRRR